jgi:RimJ/RimL family protein N-acetyltransferase
MKEVMLEQITLENMNKHIDHIMTWVNDPEVTFYFANRQKKISKPEEILFLHDVLSSRFDVLYSVFNYRREYIGQVSINKIDWAGETGRLFLVITKKQQKKGYARPVISEVQGKFFTELKLNKLYLITRNNNKKARRLYSSMGFQVEGVLREEYKVRGKRYDMVRMGLLKSEWEERWW